MVRELTVTLAQPHEAQARVLRDAARFNVVVCGRRWGKTELGIDRTSDGVLKGYPVGWYAPTYKDSKEVWRALKETLQSVTAGKNETEMRLELITGGSIDVWTLNDPDNSRGRKYGRVIIDEAAKIRYLEQAWTETIRPTLTDYKGDAWFLSTPKGRNYFYRLYQYGLQDEGWASFQMPTTANPYIDPDEVEDARRHLPQSAFEQEYMAAFTEDSGSVFRNVRGCVDASLNEAHPNGGEYFGGLDWAQTTDFTVVAVVDKAGRLVGLDRFNQLSWEIQYGRVNETTRRWGIAHGLAELNSIGSPNLERLQRDGLGQWRGFTTTSQSKAEIIQALALAFERGEIRIPDNRVLIDELESFEANRLGSGQWRYSAPEGMHDDTVIALALAWEAHNRGGAPLSFA